jgi:hypothetical protein
MPARLLVPAIMAAILLMLFYCTLREKQNQQLALIRMEEQQAQRGLRNAQAEGAYFKRKRAEWLKQQREQD